MKIHTRAHTDTHTHTHTYTHTGTHLQGYNKPNSKPLYVHMESTQISGSISYPLWTNSCSKSVFDESSKFCNEILGEFSLWAGA